MALRALDLVAQAAVLVGRGLHLLLRGLLELGHLVDVVEEGVELHVGELGPGEPGPDLGAGRLELRDLAARALIHSAARSAASHWATSANPAAARSASRAQLVLGDGGRGDVAVADGVDEGVDARSPRRARSVRRSATVSWPVAGLVDLGALVGDARLEVGERPARGGRSAPSRRPLGEVALAARASSAQAGRARRDVAAAARTDSASARRRPRPRVAGLVDAEAVGRGRPSSRISPAQGAELVDPARGRRRAGDHARAPRRSTCSGVTASSVGRAGTGCSSDPHTGQGSPSDEREAELAGDVVDAGLPQAGEAELGRRARPRGPSAARARARARGRGQRRGRGRRRARAWARAASAVRLSSRACSRRASREGGVVRRDGCGQRGQLGGRRRRGRCARGSRSACVTRARSATRAASADSSAMAAASEPTTSRDRVGRLAQGLRGRRRAGSGSTRDAGRA